MPRMACMSTEPSLPCPMESESRCNVLDAGNEEESLMVPQANM